MMKLTFEENTPVSAKQIAALRCSVGWDSMESCYADPRMNSYYHITLRGVKYLCIVVCASCWLTLSLFQ